MLFNLNCNSQSCRLRFINYVATPEITFMHVSIFYMPQHSLDLPKDEEEGEQHGSSSCYYAQPHVPVNHH